MPPHSRQPSIQLDATTLNTNLDKRGVQSGSFTQAGATVLVERGKLSPKERAEVDGDAKESKEESKEASISSQEQYPGAKTVGEETNLENCDKEAAVRSKTGHDLQGLLDRMETREEQFDEDGKTPTGSSDHSGSDSGDNEVDNNSDSGTEF